MEKHPHEKLFDKIAELLQFAYDNAEKPISEEKAKDVEAQLKALEPQIEEFTKISEKILEGSGLTDFGFETMKTDKESILSEAERNMLQRGEFLKNEAQAASNDLLKAANAAKAEKKVLTEKKTKAAKSSQSRKGKFRSLGGDKQWKPI